MTLLAGDEVAKVPDDHQLAAVRHIIQNKMTLSQVRHYISHLIAEVGTTSKRERSPKDDYAILATFIRNANEKAGQLLDLPRGLSIEALFRHRGWEDRDAALKALAELSIKITRITAQIEQADKQLKTA